MTLRPEDTEPNPVDLLALLRELLLEHMIDMNEWQPSCWVVGAHLVNASGRVLGEEEQIYATALLLTMGNGSKLRLTLTPVPSVSTN